MRPADQLAPTVPFAAALAQAPRLVLLPRRGGTEPFTGLEARDRHVVCTEQGAFTAGVTENVTGVGAVLGLWLLPGRRPFSMGLYPAEHPDHPLLVLRHRWRWLRAHLQVREAASGRLLGRIRQRWGWSRRRIDVEGADGRSLARLTGPLLRPWTMLLEVGPEGQASEVGRIEKKWPGFMREIFSNADGYLVTLPPGDTTLRQLLLAAAVLVDFLWFEDRAG